MATQHGFATIGDGQLYYEIAGEGMAVALLHGYTLDSRMWDHQFAWLAERSRVVRYDLRGFGRSSVPVAPYRHTDDLASLLDHLEIDHVTLVGLSFGGGVALEFALAYPERVNRVAVVGTVYSGFEWSAEARARDAYVWQEARRGGLEAAKAAWYDHLLFAPTRRNPIAEPRLRTMLDDYSGWHFVNRDVGIPHAKTVAEQLDALSMPVLAIVGAAEEPDFHRLVTQLVDAAPNCRSIVVPGAGHMIPIEAPDALNTLLESFLAPV